ncbi:efflux transporter outer membrane subunit [Methylomicrobium lacus]|uniref:efflux transporter outer membrane subunit n=1 Tax=Methylomicrobium lacus TaxID=136992 RepID=UPI0035A8920F
MKPSLASCLIAAGLAGCAVGPDYKETAPSVPERWQAAGLKPAQAGAKPVDSEALKRWWQSFGDAELDRLMAEALDGNLDIKIALARIDQARAERRSTRAELFPKVDVAAGAERNENPFPGFAPGIKFNLFELGFDAIWEIDLFGRQQRRLEAASADLEGAAEAYRQSQVVLTSEIARTYVEYRSLQNQLRITRSNLESQQKTLRLTERLNDEGVGTKHDVVRARAQASATESQIPAFEARLTAALRQLEVLAGRRPGALDKQLNSNRAVPAAPAVQILSSPAETIRHRPDLRVAERNLAAATAMQGAAIAELFPKLSLSAFLGLRNTDIESLFKSASFSYGTAANLLQPLLNFGRIRAGIDLADAKQKEAYLNYEKAVLEALQETETALTRYLKEEIRRQTLARTVADLKESVRLSNLRYTEGVSSFLDVLDAQRALYVAEIDLARSEADASTNLIAVYKALGGGAEAMQQAKSNSSP